ncbi:MAG: hypothetical protein NTX36_02345 [Proteobacteria bacterium]|nr:hypothetical protein [Pseudomonadota bacterium]
MLSICVLLFCTTMHVHGAEQHDGTIQAGNLPKIVAIMPFQNETEEKGIENQVRKAFYNHFSSKPYQDVELPLVDEKIIHLEKSTGKNIQEISPGDICAATGCDGIIYGRVTDFKKIYAAVYSQFSVEAEIWMVNTKTNKEVLRIKDSVTYHGGSIPLSPLGILVSAFSAATNLRDIQQIRLINELCHKINEKIPSPEGVAAEDRPAIKEVLTNVMESPFRTGKIIRTGLEGDKGFVATFDIGNFKKGIPMKEQEPGVYVGEYVVLPGDNTKDMPVIAYLKKPGGHENRWIDTAGLLTIDTMPPPKIPALKAKGFSDRVEIAWDALKEVPDLREYVVSRSEQPLTGYTELARIENNRFEDRTAKEGIVYYYRVSAIDFAGNLSEASEPVKGKIIPIKPEEITGELAKDTILLGNYVVKGTLVVPKGISLAIEPGTKVMFDEQSSLVVQGIMQVNGKDNPIESAPFGEKQWKGIIVDNGEINLSGMKIRGADTGIILKNARGSIEDAVITANDTGIFITGIPSVAVKGSHVSGNKKGVFMQKTDANILLNTIIQNEEGITIEDYSGEIQDNTIMDNMRNILAMTPARIGINYFGTINAEEMKVDGVKIQKVYDARPPEGKIVDVISSPYVALSQQERREKATALITEGQGYFGQRNYGKASGIFEESLKASPTSEAYYYLALCYQEMKEDDRVHILRLNPEDRQIKFLLERMKKTDGGKDK